MEIQKLHLKEPVYVKKEQFEAFRLDGLDFNERLNEMTFYKKEELEETGWPLENFLEIVTWEDGEWDDVSPDEWENDSTGDVEETRARTRLINSLAELAEKMVGLFPSSKFEARSPKPKV